MITLQALYAAHAGKISDKWSLYLREYERLFAPYRKGPIRLLEIGIQNGGSLELWARYFEAAEAIVGCDIDRRCADLRFDDPRISVVVADANSTLGYEGILGRSDRFDIVIDDGSHRSSDIVRSFARYFPHVEPGGLYIAEDLHCSYWEEFEGGLVDPDSSIAFFKLLVDVVNHEHWGVDKGRAELLAGFASRLDVTLADAVLAEVHSVAFVNSICVVRKARAAENTLGSRVVVGAQAFETQVGPALNGTQSRSPRQEGNRWTATAVPTRATVLEAQALQEKLTVDLDAKQRTVLELREQIQRARQELHDAAARNVAVSNRHAAAEASLRERSNELALLKTQARRVGTELARLQHESVATRKTLSWRVGAPIRHLERKRERRRSEKREKRIIEVLAASGQFDTAYYAASNPDVVATAQDPLLHFVRHGAFEGRRPNPFFDPAYYLETYPDVVAANLNPLLHYVQFGAAEGRKTSDPLSAVAAGAASAEFVRYRVDRNGALGGDVLIYVAYCPAGRLSELQRRCMEGFASDGYQIVLVVNSGSFCHYVEPGPSPAVVQIVRENVGFDFGAWGHAVRLLGGLGSARSVTFTNDSIVGPLSFDQAKSPRLSVDETPGDVVFLTESHEVRPHGQSFFFTLKHAALRLGALEVIAAAESFADKHSLILAEEVTLASRMQQLGAAVGYVYQCPQANLEVKNPTIHFWRELIDAGFPFVKASLVADSFVALDDPGVGRFLGDGFRHALGTHLLVRQQGDLARAPDPNRPPRPALAGVKARFAASNGALQAHNPDAAQTPAVLVPLEGSAAPRMERGAVFVVVHCFYVDEAEIILGELAELRMPMRLLLTTDNADKAAALQGLMSKSGLSGEVVVAPNRGRDVAPFLIEGGRRLGTETHVLHLHTKKSPHNSAYAGWGRFLRRNLIGSPAIVESIRALLTEQDVGVVYSEHFGPVSGLRNWGHDFEHARKLLMRLGIDLSSDETLDFPTSTMFWARVDALRPLFEAGLDYEDFEAEAGQVDGTLAHAIERSVLYVAEDAGFRHLKVISEGEPRDLPVISTSVEDISYMLRMRPPRLLGSMAAPSRFASGVSEVYPVDVAGSKRAGSRLTVLIPTLKPAKVYGGVASALRVAKMLFDALGPEARLRLVVTSDDVDADSLREACARMQTTLVLTEPNDDAPGSVVVDLSRRKSLPLVLQRGDLLFATAWWTADLAFRLRDRQVKLFGDAAPIVYLIQDYEPGFYAWSNQYAMALATYARADETIAVINCEELANFVTARHGFRRTFHLPYQIEPRLAALLRPTVKRRQIVVYGRPGVARNLFDILVEGLRLWQGRRPRINCEYRIVFAGESFDSRQIDELENASCVGKLPLDAYAEVLNESAIGVSLMMSPHPSYPPLEMSSAGCVTITNSYEGKDLTRRASNILSLEAATPQALAAALDEAVSRVRLDVVTPLQAVAPVPTVVEPVDVNALADSLRGGGR